MSAIVYLPTVFMFLQSNTFIASPKIRALPHRYARAHAVRWTAIHNLSSREAGLKYGRTTHSHTW